MALAFMSAAFLYSTVMLAGETRFPDESDYLTLARHLVEGKGYSLDGATPSALRPPGYSFLIAPVVALSDSPVLVRLLHFCILVASVWMLGRHAMTRSRNDGATLMLMGVIGYPVLIYTAGTVFPQTLMTGLLACLVCLCVAKQRNWISVCAVGLLTGILIEVSPTALATGPVILLFCAIVMRWPVKYVIVLALTMALVPGAWLLRNIVVLEEPILFSENLGYNIDNAVVGDEPLDDGIVIPPKGTIGHGVERLTQLIEQPDVFLGRLIDVFAYRNNLYVSTESTALRDRIMFVSYYLLLAAVLLRLIMARRHPLKPAEILVIVLYVATAILHALVIPRIRYRLPFDFLLLLPAVNSVLIMRRTLVPTR